MATCKLVSHFDTVTHEKVGKEIAATVLAGHYQTLQEEEKSYTLAGEQAFHCVMGYGSNL